MNHYFTDNRHLTENRKDLSFRFWCFNYSFVSDNGVFSKEELDEGTRILLETSLEGGLDGKILDLGCGIGPVGVVVKHNFPQCQVEMVDVNPRALELAKENAKNLIIIFHRFAAKMGKYASQEADSLLTSSMGHKIWRPGKSGTL